MKEKQLQVAKPASNVIGSYFRLWTGFFAKEADFDCNDYILFEIGNKLKFQGRVVVFDRELCSKILKEALLLFFFLLLAWNHEQNFSKWNKKYLRPKLLLIEQKVAKSK